MKETLNKLKKGETITRKTKEHTNSMEAAPVKHLIRLRTGVNYPMVGKKRKRAKIVVKKKNMATKKAIPHGGH